MLQSFLISFGTRLKYSLLVWDERKISYPFSAAASEFNKPSNNGLYSHSTVLLQSVEPIK